MQDSAIFRLVDLVAGEHRRALFFQSRRPRHFDQQTERLGRQRGFGNVEQQVLLEERECPRNRSGSTSKSREIGCFACVRRWRFRSVTMEGIVRVMLRLLEFGEWDRAIIAINAVAARSNCHACALWRRGLVGFPRRQVPSSTICRSSSWATHRGTPPRAASRSWKDGP